MEGMIDSKVMNKIKAWTNAQEEEEWHDMAVEKNDDHATMEQFVKAIQGHKRKGKG